MKRLTAALLAFGMIFALCACNSEPAQQEPQKSQQAQEADEMILAIGEVTLEKEAQILAAQAYYEGLTQQQQAEVENATLLQEKLSKLNKLKNDAAYDRAVELENSGDLQGAKALYDSLPVGFRDAADRSADIEKLLALDGRWVCKDLTVEGSDGGIYKPRYEYYDVTLEKGRLVSYTGGNSDYKKGTLPFETVEESKTGMVYSWRAQATVNDNAVVELEAHGFDAPLNGGFDSLKMLMYFDVENGVLTVRYILGYADGSKDGVVEFTYER